MMSKNINNENKKINSFISTKTIYYLMLLCILFFTLLILFFMYIILFSSTNTSNIIINSTNISTLEGIQSSVLDEDLNSISFNGNVIINKKSYKIDINIENLSESDINDAFSKLEEIFR